MADYITKIRTKNGDLQYDYNSLYGKPEPDTTLKKAGEFADAQAVGNKIDSINGRLTDINNQVTDIKNITNNFSANNITSGELNTTILPVIPLAKGGTGATNGQDGLHNLLASGPMILSAYQCGTLEDRDKLSPVEGQIFFVKV